MAKITLENFGKEMEKILEEYSDDISHNLDEVTKKVTQQGVKLIRSESQSTFGTSKRRKKKYAKSWTSSHETGRLSSQGTIYNTESGLPHLLENGHVTRNGTGRTYGKVNGREHIARVEKEIEDVYIREVKNKL